MRSTSVFSLSPTHLWLCSDETNCLIVARSVASSRPLINPQLRHCEPCFKRTWFLDPSQKSARKKQDYRIGVENCGRCSISLGIDRMNERGTCLRYWKNGVEYNE